MNKVNPTQMLSVAKCKAILEKDGSVYKPEEILLIRDFLYVLAEHEFSAYLKEKRRDLDFEKLDDQQLDEAA